MARQIINVNRFSGLSRSDKEGLKSSFFWARSMDFRSDPSKLKILPAATKSSGSVVTDLAMWGDRIGDDVYFYGNAGHIYKKTSADAWTDEHTTSDSHGNGLCYFGEDQYMYYTSDTVIGRYGPIGGTTIWVDDFLGAEGGIPLNTYSLDLEDSSSQYGHAADSASLSITGDMSIEACAKFESLPAVGASMVFASKWDGLTDQRSYFFEMYTVSGYFGDGGAPTNLTISSDTTQAPTDSACTATVATYALTATNVAFAAGDKVLIHQTQGTNAGKYERNEIASYTAGTITLQNALTNSYTTGAQVIVLPEYTNVTINSGKTYTAKAWNGTVGGILAFLASGTVTVTGTISVKGTGFRGGLMGYLGTLHHGVQGESVVGVGSENYVANSNGGGGGRGSNDGGSGGGGGSHSTVGQTGGLDPDAGYPGQGATTIVGTADLTTIVFGGGGGGAGGDDAQGLDGSRNGGIGGGICFIVGTTIIITGLINANGNNGVLSSDNYQQGGGGAGGSVLLKAQTATLGTSLITVAGGLGGDAQEGPSNNPAGVGRIHLDYYTSYTGTTTPTLDVIQDSGLVTTTTYQLRFGVSSAGTAATCEYLVKSLGSLATGSFNRYGVSWDASASKATFYRDGVNLGTSTGAVTACYNSTALFAVGSKDDDAGTAGSFFDGLIDDVRLWNDIRTDSEMNLFKESQLGGTEAGLVGYWSLNNDDDDITANNNDLTLEAAPVYSTSVPFPAATTRRDLDQSLDTSGQTDTLPIAISEATDQRQTFIPAKDPQKSIEVNIAAVGTGNWTMTVHDGLNRTIATKTVAVAELHTGDFEFTFTDKWRPVIGASYHFHLISSVADGTVVTTTLNDFETVDFHTYYQFLVESNYHPMSRFLDFIAIGNERYLAKWDGITYTPHAFALPSGYTIRCLGWWHEYLVIGTMRGTNIYDYDEGDLFLWDGTSTTYNTRVSVPEGGINAILSGDPFYFVAGYAGILMAYSGGEPIKIRQFPKMSKTTYMEVAPGGMNMWRALVHIGVGANSDNTSLEKGVYSFGSLFEDVTPTLSYDYPSSLGVYTGNNLKIGVVFPVGTNLYFGWQNLTSYGIDKVSPSNNPYATATCEFLITDMDKLWAEKEATFIRGYFKPLTSGDTMNLKYKIDRNSSWTAGTAESTADKKEQRVAFPTKGSRWNDLQVAVDMTTTNSVSPEFYGFGIELDDLQHERRT